MSDVIDKSGWLSRWPDFFPRKNRERNLSFLIGDMITIETGKDEYTQIILRDYNNLRQVMFFYNIDVYVFKFLGKNGSGFLWLDDVMHDGKADVNMSNSSKSISTVSLKGPHNRVCKIVTTTVWGWKKEPNLDFIRALRNVFDAFEYGTHPSPGSLGTNAIKTILGETQTRYTRPGNPLRQKLFEFGSGGRSEEFYGPSEYDNIFQFDFDNHYARQAKKGLPVSKPRAVGAAGIWTSTDVLDGFATAFCQVKVIIPETLNIAPLYVREQDGYLHWVKEPGEYVWWMWKEMVECCIEAGCQVEIGFAYCWTELDYFLDPFIDKAVNTRDKFKMKGMRLEEKLVKQAIVSALGSFGMRPFDYSWYLEKGDNLETFLLQMLTLWLEKE